jgi:multidrug resistance efflux pump
MSVDRYDVEAMIRDALRDYVTRSHLHHSEQDSRQSFADVRAAIAEVRSELDSVREQLESLRGVDGSLLTDIDDLRDEIVTLGKALAHDDD